MKITAMSFPSGRFSLFAWSALLFASALGAQDPAPAPTAKAPEWLQDFTAAKALAKEGNKDLLVDFTGSDWCVWCQRLDKEVFAEGAFQTGVAKDFVLVKLDFPREESLVTDEVREQNKRLQQEFAVQGFPTVFLLDSDGRPYAKTGYQQGGAEKYLGHLAELQRTKVTRDVQFAKAKDAKQIARAQHLAAGLDAIGEDLALGHYKTELQEVIELDADNAAGLKAKYAAMLDRGEQQQIATKIQEQLNELAQAGKWDEVDKLMDTSLEQHKGRKMVEQLATFFKAIAAIEGKQDFAKGLELIDSAKKFDPESDMAKRLDMIRKNIEQMQGQKEGKDQGKEPAKEPGK